MARLWWKVTFLTLWRKKTQKILQRKLTCYKPLHRKLEVWIKEPRIKHGIKQVLQNILQITLNMWHSSCWSCTKRPTFVLCYLTCWKIVMSAWHWPVITVSSLTFLLQNSYSYRIHFPVHYYFYYFHSCWRYKWQQYSSNTSTSIKIIKK